MLIKNLNFLKIEKTASHVLIKDLINIFKEKSVNYVVVYENEIIKGIIGQNELLKVSFRGLSLNEKTTGIINNCFCFRENKTKLEEVVNIFKENPNIYILLGENKQKITGLITKQVVFDHYFNKLKKKIYEVKNQDVKTKDNQFEITELINKLNEIKLSKIDLEQAFESSPTSIVILDGKGNVVRVNKEFERMTSVRKEEITGENVKDIEESGVYDQSISKIVLKEKRKITMIQKMQNGTQALVSGVPICNKNGKIYRIITNAIDLKELQIINEYFTKQKEKKENIAELYENTKIIYQSESIKKIIQLANELKSIDSTVLITGDSGVGKGVIARYMHSISDRKNEKMIEINCGAIPESLLESELFGYEAGAFTDAKKSGKPGLIELANKGVLFLDEIGEMSTQLQIKLLQVIQERKIMRVGGTKSIDVDIRIISATNKDLKEMINKGEFRLDLYYRLNVISINIPSLKERKEDIKPLCNYFLNKYNQKYNKEVSLGQSMLNMFLNYDWPGNVRELENTIERLVVTNPSGKVETNDMKSQVCSFNIHNNYDCHDNSNFIEKIVPLEEAKKELEKKLITQAYKKYKSSYKVAEILNISQATAYRKIKEYINEK